MRILVEFDNKGTIRAIATREPNVSMSLRPRPNHYVAEVEAPSVAHAQDYENLLDVKRNHKVEKTKDIGHRLVHREK